MTEQIDKIDACLATLGTDGFAQRFVDFSAALGVDQLMVFDLGLDRMRCLLSYHYSNAVLAGTLASEYLDGWYLRDPLLPLLEKALPQTLDVVEVEVDGAEMDEVYCAKFFESPGLRAKTTVIAVGSRHRLFVSFYASEGASARCDPSMAKLAARLALLHFEMAHASKTPAPLNVLSQREKAVCLGILSGQKAEAIAADLGVAPSSVVTYRKRAYAKLGITSRAGLFAICAD